MMIYAELPARRSRQVVADSLVASWIVMWLLVGYGLYNKIERLGVPGRAIQRGGSGLRRRLGEIADTVGKIPAAGDELEQPFSGAAGAAGVLERAGAAQYEAVHELALSLGILVALLPIIFALAHYLPGRYAWMKRATEAVQLRGGPHEYLLGYRALQTQPLGKLAVIAPTDLKLGEGDLQRFGQVELEDLGLRSASPT